MKRILAILFVILSFTSCHPSLRTGKEVVDKVTKTVSKKSVKKASRKAISPKGRDLITSVSLKEAERIARERKNQWQNVHLSPQFIQKLYKWGEKNGYTVNDINKIGEEFDNYAEQLYKQEYRQLKNRKSLSGYQKERFEELSKQFGKDNLMTSKAAEEYIDYLNSQNLMKSDVIQPSRAVHIFLRHTRRSSAKSSFTPDFKNRCLQEIESVAKDRSIRTTPSGQGRVTKIKEYDYTIGIDRNGKPCRHILVVLNEDGKVVSAYPVKPDATNYN